MDNRLRVVFISCGITQRQGNAYKKTTGNSDWSHISTSST